MVSAHYRDRRLCDDTTPLPNGNYLPLSDTTFYENTDDSKGAQIKAPLTPLSGLFPR